MLHLKNDKYEIVIADDQTYTSSSADNTRVYDKEYLLGDSHFYQSSQHTITVKAGSSILHSCILIAEGGITDVHDNSALLHGNSCIVAIGPFMCSLQLPSLSLEWQARVDEATCFGVYHSSNHHCFISHGELEIARVSYDGKIIWSSGGKDIFTNGFKLYDDYIEVVDFNGERYKIDTVTGRSELTEG